jgi:hypothetical protein
VSGTAEDYCGDGAFTPASEGWLYRIFLRHQTPAGMRVCVSPIVSLAVGEDRRTYLPLPRVCARTGTHRRRSLHLLVYSVTGTDALSDEKSEMVGGACFGSIAKTDASTRRRV